MSDTMVQDAKAAAGTRGRRKRRTGVVVAANTAKTIVVSVGRRVMHDRYSKYQSERRKFAVHDLMGCAVGEHVRIEETRPLSKTKRWRVIERLAKA